MATIDNPMLALIARFVVKDIDDLRIQDEEFLQHQVNEIKCYVGDAEGEDRRRLALEWIREHAGHYRHEWQKKELSRIVLDKYCADCPLAHRGKSKPFCSIHNRWVSLLKKYLADRITSEKYVEETLELLNHHKENLKISTIFARVDQQ